MKLLFLGTGAAGSMKRNESEMAEGKRRCASMMIDENVLVDIARQSFDHATKLGCDTSAVTDIFLSHAHGDHFYRETLLQYAAAAKTKLRFWCHRGAVANLKLSEEDMALVDIRPVDVLDTWETAGMTVTALPANHISGDLDSREQPLHYLFEKDGKKMYYGCDGGWYTAVEWEYLRQHKVVLDAVIMDATVGEDAGNFRIATHNNLAMLEIMVLALRQNGILSENALLIANHIHDPLYNAPDHEGQTETFARLGMVMADDGKSFEI